MFSSPVSHLFRPHGEAELARSQWEVEQLGGAQARVRVAFWTYVWMQTDEKPCVFPSFPLQT